MIIIILIILLANCVKSINNINVANKVGQMGRKENQELINASRKGDIEGVLAALNMGANINHEDTQKDGDNRTALIYASEDGYLEIVKLLIKKGANINAKIKNYYTANGATSLIMASRRENIEIIKLLLENGADINTKTNCGNTALLEASQRGNSERIEVVKLLIERGANVNHKNNRGSTALMYASEKGHTNVVRLLLDNNADINISNKKGETALICASSSGDIKTVKLLLERGANPMYIYIGPYKQNATVLTNAASKGYVDIVRLFEKEFRFIDPKGLINAIHKNNIKKIKSLLEEYINEEYLNTAFLLSLVYKNKEASKLLLEKGAKVDYIWKYNACKNTNLIQASIRCDEELVKLLLENGADINYKNSYNKNALNAAAEKLTEDMEEKGKYINIAYVLIQAIKTNYIILLKNLESNFIDIITKEKAKNIIEKDIIFINSLQKLPKDIFVEIIKYLNH